MSDCEHQMERHQHWDECVLCGARWSPEFGFNIPMASGMNENFRQFAKAVSGYGLHPWQLRLVKELDEYYLTASALGIKRPEAERRLSARIARSRGSLSYSHEDALRDARSSLYTDQVND